ncbi:cupredoxin domain-containing protein [Kitasatospora sp. NPDC127111]|uniref:cupredoxin domain-containing protein n=1 Tax=Kitasatospora sp. NPDC127111 TaxID=3345363 RepID=UPI0036409F5D
MTFRSSRAWRTTLAVGAAVWLLLGTAGCSSDGGGGGTASASPSAPASAPSSPSATPSSPVFTSATPAPATSAPATAVTVTIKDFLFHPDTLTVAPGTKITVTNQDSAEHTLTAVTPGKEFDTGLLAKGQSATITAPSTPGSYPFHCDVHPNMKGTLVVR